MTTIDISQHKAVIVPALFAYLSETDAYLRGFDPDAEPRPEDLCCAYHRGRWDAVREDNERLLARRAQIVDALRAIGETPWEREP